MASVPPDKNMSVMLLRAYYRLTAEAKPAVHGLRAVPILMKTTKGSHATLWRRRGDNVSAEATGCQGMIWWTRGCVGERLVLQGLAVLWSAGTEVAVREHTTGM
jgi:hypothetical protein